MCLPGTHELVRKRFEVEGAPTVDRRTALLGAAGAALAASFPASALANGGKRRRGKERFQDLTHTFTDGFPVFTGDPPHRETLFDYASAGFYAQQWTFGEHSGTHMDVPGHFHEGGRLSPDITPPELIVPIVVVDIRKKARNDPNAMVELDDIRKFEKRHCRISEGTLVAANSGWASKVGDPDAFKGGPAFPEYNFPGWSEEAAMFLAEERNVSGIGIDTLSLDPGNSLTFPVHVSYLATDRYGIENLAGLDGIPSHGATAYVGVIPWEEGSGGPCRVIAHW
jgi:kynurenine formamidase